VANEACVNGRVKINGKVSKPGTIVKVGDIVEIQFGEKAIKAEVLNLSQHVKKEEAQELYIIID
jgi:ribosomal 50S subunit-recycling heat shock protein